MKKLTLIPLLLIFLSCMAQAQPFLESSGPEMINGRNRYIYTATFEVTPRVPEEPALRYKLTWGSDQRTAMNAAVKYNFAAKELTQYQVSVLVQLGRKQQEDFDKVLTDPDFLAEKQAERDAFENEIAALPEDSLGAAERRRFEATAQYQSVGYSHYCSVPREKFPMDKAKEFVRGFQNAYRHLEAGSRCDYCDWEHPIRGNENPIAILLPEVQEARDLARALQVKARVEIYEGDYESAIKTIRVGKQLAKHTAEEPIIVSVLVGIAIDGMMDAVLAELIRQPDAPNLYWTLTALPQKNAMVSAMEWEMDMLRALLPGLAKAMETPDELSDADWKDLHHRAIKTSSEIAYYEGPPSPFNESLQRLSGLIAYPQAKQWLIDSGKTPEEVEAMSTAKVLGLWSVHRYQVVRDGMLKIISLPHEQRMKCMGDWESKMRQDYQGSVLPIDVLVNALFPAVGAAFSAETRSSMTADVLRIVEALRLYAAQKNGKLPEKLDDIVAVPIPPLDPFSGKPYDYKIKDGAAVIEVDLGWGVQRFVVRMK